jgi:hypothetical protein
MYQTIQLSSCVLVQGEFVASLADGKIVIRDGGTEYRGRPIAARPAQMMAGAPVRGRESAAHQG